MWFVSRSRGLVFFVAFQLIVWDKGKGFLLNIKYQILIIGYEEGFVQFNWSVGMSS